jgi:hypothetical protein
MIDNRMENGRRRNAIIIVEKKIKHIWAFEGVQWLVAVLLLPTQNAYFAAKFVAMLTKSKNSGMKRRLITLCLLKVFVAKIGDLATASSDGRAN